MIARGLFHLLRPFAMLLLATIGLQALAPLPVPFERDHGSAFSSGTLNVALVSSDRATAAKATPRKPKFFWTGPPDGPPPCGVCRAPTADGSAIQPQSIRPASRAQGPAILDLIPLPRAPPAA